MGVLWHLVEHRLLKPVVSRMATPRYGNHKRLPCSTRPDWPCRFAHPMPSGRRQRWVRWVLVCLIFAQFPVALAQDVDEGEFSPAMLRYKLEVLNNQFKEAEVQLLTRGMAGSTLKK